MKDLIYILIAISLISCGQNNSSENESDKNVSVVQSENQVVEKAEEKSFVSPYTDYSITAAILTETEITDSNLLSLLQFEGIQINNRKKAIEIDTIQSKKGIKLGLSIDEVKAIFGVPKTAERLKNKDLLMWQFFMVENGESNKVGGLRPFIIEGLEFIAEMKFVDKKLTQVVYKYEVP